MSEKNILHAKFVQKPFEGSDEWGTVSAVADELLQYLKQEETLIKIKDANIPGAHSSLIQSILLERGRELGFVDESTGLFQKYTNKKLRPDYFLKIGSTGILMEVERGKTNQNNMDFLDIWKCHICEVAHYLFLCVPIELRQNSSERIVGRPFQTVSDHMSSFFVPENYINVRGAIVIGY